MTQTSSTREIVEKAIEGWLKESEKTWQNLLTKIANEREEPGLTAFLLDRSIIQSNDAFSF